MENTVISSTHFCHPQERNIHNFIFGGYLMREAYEIAFSCASMFIQDRPVFVSMDEISFKKPVKIGSILQFTAKVVYSSSTSFQVKVIADVIDVKSGNRETTNTFYLTFQHKDLSKRLLPKTYSDAMEFIEGLRRKNRGIALKNQV
jgi:acyl-coenzyme A thioesterase 9